jgi:hypothetical protein
MNGMILHGVFYFQTEGIDMASQLKWNGKKFTAQLEKATAEGMMMAGQFLHTKCRLAVSKPNTGRSVPVKRKRPGGNKRTRTIYPNPSKPGESPRLRTGFGRNNIVVNHDPKGRWTRVGVTQNGIYMFYLEVGTRRIARRPWLLKTLYENRKMIGRLAAIGGKRHLERKS